MRAVIHSYRVCEVIYFNCRVCGAALWSEKERKLGWCGCALKGASPRTKRQAFDDGYDPYGQPVKVKNKAA